MTIISKTQNETKVEINGMRFAFRNSDGWICWMGAEVDLMALEAAGILSHKNYRNCYSATKFFFNGYKGA